MQTDRGKRNTTLPALQKLLDVVFKRFTVWVAETVHLKYVANSLWQKNIFSYCPVGYFWYRLTYSIVDVPSRCVLYVRVSHGKKGSHAMFYMQWYSFDYCDMQDLV